MLLYQSPLPGQTDNAQAFVNVVQGSDLGETKYEASEGGFPYEALQVEMRALGITVPLPPSSGS